MSLDSYNVHDAADENCVCVRACACVCVRVRACVCACVCAYVLVVCMHLYACIWNMRDIIWHFRLTLTGNDSNGVGFEQFTVSLLCVTTRALTDM